MPVNFNFFEPLAPNTDRVDQAVVPAAAPPAPAAIPAAPAPAGPTDYVIYASLPILGGGCSI